MAVFPACKQVCCCVRAQPCDLDPFLSVARMLELGGGVFSNKHRSSQGLPDICLKLPYPILCVSRSPQVLPALWLDYPPTAASSIPIGLCSVHLTIVLPSPSATSFVASAETHCLMVLEAGNFRSRFPKCRFLVKPLSWTANG